MSSWHSYGSIYNMGHRALTNLFDGAVVVEEKIDGSQFSFGVIDGVLRCRSKGQELVVDAPEKMFSPAVATAVALAPLLAPEWTYRGEYLSKPKHNTLGYNRIPTNHIIIFDIATDEEAYLPYDLKAAEAARLGLEVVPRFTVEGRPDVSDFTRWLEAESVLGGPRVEGVVVKNYAQFGPDKKTLMGKHVSEAFKEVHQGEWKRNNPTKADIVEAIIAGYRTPARWSKAVQHLTEAGIIENSPRDIGALMREVGQDVLEECEEDIKDALWKYAWPKIQRGVTGGLPEWYKGQLLERQFDASST